MADIVLATLNARYSHASLGLRYLHANLGDLRPHCALVEATVAAPIEAVVERILAHAPRVLGLGVYIWNVQRTLLLVKALRSARPQLKIVLGGPEVSHETEEQEIVALADHVITGPGDLSFARLARQLLRGPRPLQRIVAGEAPDPATLASPYDLYDATDIAHRNLYVEASRGCPFKCEFCLSALDRTAVPFPLDAFLERMDELYRRGARRLRFVDRTFNLKPATGVGILGFLLERIRARPDDPMFAHFELVPDHLPEPLKALITQFPPGSLQFEIGIQTWSPAVQRLIGRRQDNARAEANLRWLRAHSTAHLHVDLIAGLPGETMASFAAGFDRLWALEPHEIQLGVLKRLRGAPIRRHESTRGLRFDSAPPYTVRHTDAMSADEIASIVRIARHWDLIGNSGRFTRGLRLLLADAPFARLAAFSAWLHQRLDARSHRIALETLHEAMLDYLVCELGNDRSQAVAALAADYAASGARGRPAFLARGLAGGRSGPPHDGARAAPERQRRALVTAAQIASADTGPGPAPRAVDTFAAASSN